MLPTLPAHAIARNLARALVTAPEFVGACQARFGAAPSVFLDAVGTRDWESLYPFAVVSLGREDVERGIRTFSVEVLLCVRALGDEPGSAKPLQAAGGFFEFPGTDAMQDVAAGLVLSVRNAALGAVFDSWGADWDFGSEWPEQSALLTFNFHNTFSFNH